MGAAVTTGIERSMSHPLATTRASCIALALLAFAMPAGAQSPGLSGPHIAQAQTPAAPARAPKAQPKSDAGAAAGGATSGDQGLRQRVESLEEQLVDLQVTIGTLESLAKGGGAGAGSTAGAPVWRGGGASAGGADQARLNDLEMQIRALASQLEQLSSEVRGGRRSENGGGRGYAAAPGDAEPPVSRFGSTTVTAGTPPASSDPIGGLIDRAPLPDPTQRGGVPAPAPGGAPAPTAGDAGAKQLYETAYGYLLQQDYGAAEAAFDDFLKRYPSDQLAGNAQYWLGETHFVRGQFKAAASAFLKGYQTYARSPKAPDSLLKLAISLDRLGQRDAACSSFSELNAKYPTAPSHVKTRADSERRRLGCS
jgi:tol-pal system protein YbgF